MADSIDQLRKQIRKKRSQLGIRARFQGARNLLVMMKSSTEYKNSRHIACYVPVSGEVDCMPLIKDAWKKGKHCYLPVIKDADTLTAMTFVKYKPVSRLFKNQYGIPEPRGVETITPRSLDLALAPLVACDRNRNRMGMGGGYYDYTFAFKLQRTFSMKEKLPKLVGLAYSFQRVNKVVVRPWDVKLDKVYFVA